jgi:hypothetical protein
MWQNGYCLCLIIRPDFSKLYYIYCTFSFTSLKNQIKDNRTIFKKIGGSISKVIDYPAAIAGAVIMGVIVGYINRKFGAWPATTASLKQAAYTFLFGGILTKLLYIIQGKIPGKF